MDLGSKRQWQLILQKESEPDRMLKYTTPSSTYSWLKKLKPSLINPLELTTKLQRTEEKVKQHHGMKSANPRLWVLIHIMWILTCINYKKRKEVMDGSL